MTTLDDPAVAALLKRLHAEARGDAAQFLRAAPTVALAWLRGQSAMNALTPRLKHAFLPVEPAAGRFLYLAARAIAARRVVEFGTSFGISTIYLAAAVRDNGGGELIGTELEPNKRERARAHLAEAGLADLVDIRLGDARETLARDVAAPIDLLFLDGWKDLYVEVLTLLTPRLRPGALVLADNVRTFKRALAPYVATVRAGHGFASTTLPFRSGLEVALRLPATG